MVLLTFLPLPIGAEAIAEARAFATYEHNAVPLATLRIQLGGGITPFELRNLVGNFVLLLPLGIYGPILTPRLRSVPAILLAGVALSAVIEIGQLVVASAYGFPVRVADVDDVVLNALGVLTGYILWRAWSGTGSVDSDHAIRRSADGR